MLSSEWLREVARGDSIFLIPSIPHLLVRGSRPLCWTAPTRLWFPGGDLRPEMARAQSECLHARDSHHLHSASAPPQCFYIRGTSPKQLPLSSPLLGASAFIWFYSSIQWRLPEGKKGQCNSQMKQISELYVCSSANGPKPPVQTAQDYSLLAWWTRRKAVIMFMELYTVYNT